MRKLSARARVLASGAVALPLSLMLVGAAGELAFDPATPWARMGAPPWLLVAWGAAELALLVGLWLPFLHRLAGAAVAADALVHAWAHAVRGRTGHVVAYVAIAAMGAALALLWSSAPVAAISAERWHRRRLAGRPTIGD